MLYAGKNTGLAKMKDKCFNYGFESHSKVQYVYNTLLEKMFIMFLKPADL